MDFLGCAVPYKNKFYEIPPLAHRSTDIYIKRSKVQPEPPAQLTTQYFPGTDQTWNQSDVQFNYCTDSDFVPGNPQNPGPGNAHAVLIHEIGHALGLHGGQDQDPNNDQTRHHPNSRIFHSVMSHGVTTGQDCSPHPLDIMALYAIYQTEE